MPVISQRNPSNWPKKIEVIKTKKKKKNASQIIKIINKKIKVINQKKNVIDQKKI